MSSQQHHYFVPQPSMYPFITAISMFLMACGFVLKINKFGLGLFLMLAGFAGLLYILINWFGTIIREAEGGSYKQWEDQSFRTGMIWFIASEVAFFAAFFGALFYERVIAVPDLAGQMLAHGTSLWPDFTAAWPTSGPRGEKFTPMGAVGIPAINTALLLSSGVTLTFAHWGLLKNNRKQLILGMAATIALGVLFLILQAYEYHHAYTELGLNLGAGVYGATFFMLTGFHGFHVTLGAIMLSVILGRCMKGHFTAERHFGFEGVAWYWHFVDVVWLLLFVLVYWL